MRLTASLIITLSTLLVSGAVQAQPPAGTTAMCKDGTYSSAASKRGACSGHKGVGQWMGASDAPAQKTPVSTPVPSAPSPSVAAGPVKQTPAPRATVAAGGAGQVWVNTKSNVYHCQGDRYYGNTKAGSYMTEAAAVAAGDRPDHGKACH